jgi:HK97 family phage portal protein
MGFLAKELRNSIQSGGSLTAYNDFWYNAIGGGPTKAGVPVNEETAIKYLAVFSCVSLIAGDIASLPLILYQTGKDGSKKRAENERIYDVLKNQPNRNTDSFHWRETGQTHLLTWGNTYSDIKREPRTGEIIELNQIYNPGSIKIKRNRKGIYYEWSNNRLCNEIAEDQGKWGTEKRLKKDMFHLAGFGFNGLVGMSVIGIAREAIALGIAARDYGSLFFGQGIHPSGVFETDKNLGDNAQAFAKNIQKQFGSLGESHKGMVLDNGIKFKQITIPMDDAQFIATRKHQDLDICGMYKVPPHKIGIHGANSNNNNLEQENGSYVSQCLRPWLVRWEQSMNMQLLTPEQRQRGLFFEILAEGLLRGDQAARAAYFDSQWSKGAMSANDINKVENRNPVPGGDQYFVPLNFIPSDMAADFATKEDEPAQKIESKTFRSLSGSIILRDRISKQYYPLFQRAAQEIVNKESLAVKFQVNKQRKSRENRDMQTWLDDFYRKLPDEIKSKIGPVIRSFSEAIQAASAEEMGVDVGISDDLERFINDYTERYAQRHTESSLGQLTALLEEDLDALEERVSEWVEKRADKIASNETVRASNAVYQAVAFGIGLSTVWRIRGKTCPFCRSLNGKRVIRGQSFVKDGQELNPDGAENPMRINGTKHHPPLHRSCDCYLSVF